MSHLIRIPAFGACVYHVYAQLLWILAVPPPPLSPVSDVSFEMLRSSGLSSEPTGELTETMEDFGLQVGNHLFGTPPFACRRIPVSPKPCSVRIAANR
jgi:hypothetical protein